MSQPEAVIEQGDTVKVLGLSSVLSVLAVEGDWFWCRQEGRQPNTYHRAVLAKVDPS